MMKKVWLVLLAVVLVFGFAVLGCGGGGGEEPGGPGGPTDPGWENNLTEDGNLEMVLASNFQYGDGYQVNYMDAALFKGKKITKGDVYTLEISFTGSRDLTASESGLTLGLVDTVTGYWNPLSWDDNATPKIEQLKIEEKALKTTGVTDLTLTFTALKSAPSAAAAENALNIQFKSPDDDDGSAATVGNPVTLIFTKFIFKKAPSQEATTFTVTVLGADKATKLGEIKVKDGETVSESVDEENMPEWITALIDGTPAGKELKVYVLGTDAEWDMENGKVTKDMSLYIAYVDKVDIVVVPPEGFDAVALGNVTSGVGNGTTQLGWASNMFQKASGAGIATDVEVEDFLQATYLWIWFKNNPAGGMQIAWQGDGENVSDTAWFQVNVLENNGSPSANVELGPDQGGYALKVKLADVLGTKDSNNGPDTSYTAAKAGIKFIIGYYSGGGFASLGDRAAYLLLPTGTINGRGDYFTVTFDTDGGTPATIADVSVLTGYPLGAKYPAAPTKAEKTFGGWFAGGTEYTKYTSITSDAALKAKWLSELTVTFDYGYQVEGADKKDVVKIGEGQKLSVIESSIPAPGADPEGNVFDGWYSTDTFTAGSELDLDNVISADATYYAKYLPPVTINFNLGIVAGEIPAISSITIPAGTAAGDKFPAAPAFIGHSFDGWKDTSSASYTAATIINADVTLTAQWTQTATYLLKLGAMNANNSAKQNGWLFGGTGVSITNIDKAKFLVIKIDGKLSTNPWGIGGADIIYQVGGTGWEQHEISKPTDGWANFNFQNQIIYLVIDLTKVVTDGKKDWSDVITSADGTKLFIQTWLELNGETEKFGYADAYLIDDISGTKDLELLLDVYVTRSNLGF